MIVRRSSVASRLTVIASRSASGSNAVSSSMTAVCARLRANAQAAASAISSAASSSAFFLEKTFMSFLPLADARKAKGAVARFFRDSSFVVYAFLSNFAPQFLQVTVTLPTPRGTRRRRLHFGQVK